MIIVSMSYGDLELKRVINEPKYLEYSGIILLVYTIWIFLIGQLNYALFIPHVIFIMGWVLISDYNDENEKHNGIVLSDMNNVDTVYHDSMKEALKL